MAAGLSCNLCRKHAQRALPMNGGLLSVPSEIGSARWQLHSPVLMWSSPVARRETLSGRAVHRPVAAATGVQPAPAAHGQRGPCRSTVTKPQASTDQVTWLKTGRAEGYICKFALVAGKCLGLQAITEMVHAGRANSSAQHDALLLCTGHTSHQPGWLPCIQHGPQMKQKKPSET